MLSAGAEHCLYMGGKICQIGCVSKVVGGVLLYAYCKVVDLFWDHYWLKPRTRVSILVILEVCKSGRGGVTFGPILQSGRFIILVSKISIFAYVLLVF